MAQFEIPEKYKAKYDALEMTQDDWDSMQKDISIHCFKWAKIQYLKKQFPEKHVMCNEGLSCVCSYSFIGHCGVPELYCSHQYLKTW